MIAARRLSLRDLHRTTLDRQWLLQRHRATPAKAVGALAGLQAQHANPDARPQGEDEAERLVRFVEPEATRHGVAWTPAT